MKHPKERPPNPAANTSGNFLSLVILGRRSYRRIPGASSRKPPSARSNDIRADAASEFEQLPFVIPIRKADRGFVVVVGWFAHAAFRRGLSALALGTPRSIRTRDSVPSVSRVCWFVAGCCAVLLLRCSHV
uniref:Uncharacterized protein n=1 Tax=Anopheles atroparvus TaxID=41427 RepID=A0A182J445_ANOAO